jgi:hypothetical protein
MLISSITKLETVGLPLHDALEIIEDVMVKLGGDQDLLENLLLLVINWKMCYVKTPGTIRLKI